MFKFIILFFSVSLLTACTWGDSFAPENIFLKLPITEIQTWQKKDSIGHTNAQQRWKDFQECGVKNYNNGNLDLNESYGISDIAMKNRRTKIINCMENKSYIVLDEWQCINENQTKLKDKCT